MIARLKHLAKSSRWLVCAAAVARDLRVGWNLRRGQVETDSGAAHAGFDLHASLDYIERVYRGYLVRAGIDRFDGAVAEIGPGDNFGVAALILGHGATRVDAIDRYYSRRDSSQQARIYQALAERHGLQALFGDERPGEAIAGLHYHYGHPAETFFRTAGLRFNAIVSCAVLEHLYDPLGALTDMAGALDPGGVMVHQVDLSDHGMFPRHPALTFLTIPRWLYRWMVTNGGRPNRVLVDRYRDWLASSGLDGSILITGLAGSREPVPALAWEEIEASRRQAALAEVARVRQGLAQEFAPVADADLAVSSFVLTVHKRDCTGTGKPSQG